MTDKELAHKRKNIAETVKITKAMQAISSAMIIPLERKRNLSKDYLDMFTEGVASFNLDFPKSTGDVELVISIAGDKGLCGDFNNLVINETQRVLNSTDNYVFYPIGMFLYESFKELENISLGYLGLASSLNEEETNQLARECLKSYLNGEIKSVRLIYVEAKTRMEQEVKNEVLLPVTISKEEKGSILLGEYNKEELLIELITAKIYYALCSTEYALNCKRFATMKQATENGEKLENELVIAFNRARQNKITNELNDSVASNLGKRL